MPKPKKRRQIKLDATAMVDKTITLSQPMALATSGIEIDREAGLLKNVSIITRGPALGHDFVVDEKTLKQVASILKKKKRGVKSRLTHPGFLTDGIEYLVGRAAIGDARVDGDQVRADIQLGQYAKSSPKGDLWTYLLDVAEEAPDIFGLSIVFVPGDYEERKDEDGLPVSPAGRVKDVLAVDFVGDPGANPGGLLSRPQPQAGTRREEDAVSATGPVSMGSVAQWYGDQTMNEKLKKYLTSIGLKADATEKEAIAFWNTRDGDEKELADALATAKPKEPEPKPADEPKPEKPAAAAKADGDDEKLSNAARAAEHERFKEISGIAKEFKLDAEWAEEAFLGGKDMPALRLEVLETLVKARQPVSTGAMIEVGRDRDRESLAPAMTDAILLRAGVKLMEIDPVTRTAKRDEAGRLAIRAPHERTMGFRAMSVLEMGRTWLRGLGIPGVEEMHRPEVAELIMSRQRLQTRYGAVALTMGTGDFPYILEDSMRKSLRAAYEEVAHTWEIWTRRTTAPDFKDVKRLSLSEAPALVARAEGLGITYVTLGEGRETYALAEYAQGIRLTRKAMVNDDLDAFGRIPMLQAAAARRKEDDVCYGVLTANAAMGDTVKLFDTATHKNYPAAGAAPSVTTLNAAYALMRMQQGPKSAAYLNIEPAFILIPPALRGTVMELLSSTVRPDATAANVKNIWEKSLTPVTEARLQADSAVKWYLAAQSNQIDTVEVCFLEGEETPVLAQETDFDSDDIKYKVRHTVASKAIDYRGLFLNKGA